MGGMVFTGGTHIEKDEEERRYISWDERWKVTVAILKLILRTEAKANPKGQVWCGRTKVFQSINHIIFVWQLEQEYSGHAKGV